MSFPDEIVITFPGNETHPGYDSASQYYSGSIQNINEDGAYTIIGIVGGRQNGIWGAGPYVNPAYGDHFRMKCHHSNGIYTPVDYNSYYDNKIVYTSHKPEKQEEELIPNCLVTVELVDFNCNCIFKGYHSDNQIKVSGHSIANYIKKIKRCDGKFIKDLNIIDVINENTIIVNRCIVKNLTNTNINSMPFLSQLFQKGSISF